MWRVVTSERFSVSSPQEVLGGWTMEDLLDAHLLLDMFDRLDAKAAQKA